MSDTIKKALTKQDFCKPDCSCDDWGSKIFPETSMDQVHVGDITLENWIGDGSGYTLENFILHILSENPPTIDIPKASKTTFGIVKIGDGIDVSNGVISVNGGSSPTGISYATTNKRGGIRLLSDIDLIPGGSSTNTWDDFVDDDIELSIKEITGECFAMPLLTTDMQNTNMAKEFAFTLIPKSWITSSVEFLAGDHIKIDENTISSDDFVFDYNSTKLTSTEVDVEYRDLLDYNGDVNYVYFGNKTNWLYTNGTLGLDSDSEVSLEFGFPRVALLSGAGIKFDKYTETFKSNPWSNDGQNKVDEFLISLFPASSTELGGIKLGFTENDKNRAIQLDEYGKAFVNIESKQLAGLISTNLSVHYFAINYRTGESEGYFGVPANPGDYIPLITTQKTQTNNKCSVLFEILGREDSKTYYAKYYFNTYADEKLVCMDFYSNNEEWFSHNDIVVGKDSSNKYWICKHNHCPTNKHEFFIINVIAENGDSYSEQHYFYTGDAGHSSIAEQGYSLRSDMILSSLSSMTSVINCETYKTELIREAIPNTSPVEYKTVFSDSYSLDVKANQKYKLNIALDTASTFELELPTVEDSKWESIVILNLYSMSGSTATPTYNIPIELTVPEDVIIEGGFTTSNNKNTTTIAAESGFTHKVLHISHNIIRIDKY